MGTIRTPQMVEPVSSSLEARAETIQWFRQSMRRDEDVDLIVRKAMIDRGYGSIVDFVTGEPGVADALRIGLQDMIDQDPEINDVLIAREEAARRRVAEQEARRLRGAGSAE